jgi:hypothetical protein
MTDPKDYQATDAEVRLLADQVIRDHAAKQAEARRKVREFQETGKESVE